MTSRSQNFPFNALLTFIGFSIPGKLSLSHCYTLSPKPLYKVPLQLKLPRSIATASSVVLPTQTQNQNQNFSRPEDTSNGQGHGIDMVPRWEAKEEDETRGIHRCLCCFPGHCHCSFRVGRDESQDPKVQDREWSDDPVPDNRDTILALVRH